MSSCLCCSAFVIRIVVNHLITVGVESYSVEHPIPVGLVCTEKLLNMAVMYV